MQVGVGKARRGLIAAAVAAGLLTGCADGAQEDAGASADPSASASKDAGAADGGGTARSGGTIGATGSACELPVTFDIAEKWTAEAVEGASGEADGELAEEVADALLRQGPVTAACEVDAKPAGHIGFLRVFTADPGEDDARTVLKGFVEAEVEASKERYGTFEAGGLTGAEVEYLYTSELLEEPKTERAFAVVTARGPVVVHLGGMDTAEHEAMLPAYELAKRTLRGS
ncbi:lipoprotein [Streptomyces sp. AS58]|uniref:lipoprotein n=1 Tax=Streptomyces sp. AS58 TaxID=1519489 RepID=UPI0006B04A62|nr:lipoprotein [Streptomyces sp. AS58]